MLGTFQRLNTLGMQRLNGVGLGLWARQIAQAINLLIAASTPRLTEGSYWGYGPNDVVYGAEKFSSVFWFSSGVTDNLDGTYSCDGSQAGFEYVKYGDYTGIADETMLIGFEVVSVSAGGALPTFPSVNGATVTTAITSIQLVDAVADGSVSIALTSDFNGTIRPITLKKQIPTYGAKYSPELVDWDNLASQGTGWMFTDGVLDKNADDSTVFVFGADVVEGDTIRVTYTKSDHTIGNPTFKVGLSSTTLVMSQSDPAGMYRDTFVAPITGALSLAGTTARFKMSAMQAEVIYPQTQQLAAAGRLRVNGARNAKTVEQGAARAAQSLDSPLDIGAVHWTKANCTALANVIDFSSSVWGKVSQGIQNSANPISTDEGTVVDWDLSLDGTGTVAVYLEDNNGSSTTVASLPFSGTITRTLEAGVTWMSAVINRNNGTATEVTVLANNAHEVIPQYQTTLANLVKVDGVTSVESYGLDSRIVDGALIYDVPLDATVGNAEQRENLIIRSSDPTYWLDIGGSNVDTGEIRNGMKKVAVISAGASWHRTVALNNPPIPHTAGDKISFNMFYMAGTSGLAAIYCYDNTAAAGSTYTGAPGALVAASTAAGAISNVTQIDHGEGLFEFRGTITLTATGANFTLGLSPYSAVSGETVFALGAQITLTDTPQPFVPTDGSAVTHDADVPYFDTPSVWTPQNGAFEISLAPEDILKVNNWIFSLFDGDFDGYFGLPFFAANDIRFRKIVSGSAYDAIASYTAVNGTRMTIRGFWHSTEGTGVKAADADGDIDGATLGTNPNVDPMILLDSTSLCHRGGASIFPAEVKIIFKAWATKEAAVAEGVVW